MESLIRFFDGYSRTARLYPALLTLAPLVLTVALAEPGAINSGKVQAIVSVVVLLGGTYLIASLARSRGKVREQELLKVWGGWPTTILLRHSDDTIDPETKARYHGLLAAMTGKPTTTKVEELLDPKGCDHRYRAATTRLMEARRDAKYGLVHNENASYGFRRNLLGLKPVGIAVSLSAMLVAVAAWQIGLQGFNGISLILAGWNHPVPVNLLTAFVLDSMFAFLWVSVVTEGFVRQAANEYALALLRTLDEGTASQRSAGLSATPSSDATMRSMLLSLLRYSRASTGAKMRSTRSRPRVTRPNAAKP
jgi:hypothetical protein